MAPAPSQFTEDGFLGGQLRLMQPAAGYRAGVDPVFLAASIPAKPGQRVLELGCGVGTALLCLGHRVKGLALTGVELQPLYANCARRNAANNNIAVQVVEADLLDLPSSIRQSRYHHVLANPPYFLRDQGTPSAEAGREIALGEQTPLALWVQTAAKRLEPGGFATFIQRADRLDQMLSLMAQHFGSLQVLPFAPRLGRDCHLVLVRGRKAGRAALRLHAPVILHQGEAHLQDTENYCPDISAVLRDAHPLYFPQ
ncbi:MAG: methyltransferase [Paracoccaceae bacterium]|nr:methyltransferase [Paracoccaceae bacterium]